jgi:hypothetical protein
VERPASGSRSVSLSCAITLFEPLELTLNVLTIVGLMLLLGLLGDYPRPSGPTVALLSWSEAAARRRTAVHSYRSASIGSTREARRAGT